VARLKKKMRLLRRALDKSSLKTRSEQCRDYNNARDEEDVNRKGGDRASISNCDYSSALRPRNGGFRQVAGSNLGLWFSRLAQPPSPAFPVVSSLNPPAGSYNTSSSSSSSSSSSANVECRHSAVGS